jgi:hypothetical protein
MPKVETAPKIDGNLSTASERMTQDASWNLHGASHSIVQFIAAYLLAVIIFGLDVFLHRPLLAVLYIVPVALAGFWSRSNQPSRVVVVTGFCTLLVGAGLLVLPSLDSILLTDRLLVLATIWITAILSLLRKKQEELDLLRGMLPLCASCKKIRDTTGYWEQLESYLRNHLRVGYSHSFCPECAAQLLLLAKRGTFN